MVDSEHAHQSTCTHVPVVLELNELKQTKDIQRKTERNWRKVWDGKKKDRERKKERKRIIWRRKQRRKIPELMNKTTKHISEVSSKTFGKALSTAKRHLPKCFRRKVLSVSKDGSRSLPQKNEKQWWKRQSVESNSKQWQESHSRQWEHS